VSWLALAGLLWDPLAPAAMPKLAAMFAGALAVGGGPRRLPAAAAVYTMYTAWMAWRSPDFAGWLAAGAVMLAALSRPVEEARAAAGPVAAAMGGGASCFALWQFVAGGRWLHGGQGNPDWLGLVVAAALPLTAEWAATNRRRWVVALEIAGLLCSRSRTAFLAAAVALLWRRWPRQIVALAVAVALFSIPALEGRIWIWRHAAAVTAHHPLLGAGEFTAAFAEAQGASLRALPPAEATRRFVYTPSAHDDYLQAAAEAGLPALLLLLTTLYFAARGHASTIVCIAVAAAGDRPLAQPPVLILLALVIAAAPSREVKPLPLITPLVCAAGLALTLPSWWAARLCTRARDEAPVERAATLALAEAADGRSGPVAFEVGLAAAERHDLPAAIAHFEAARRRYFQPATEIALGNALAEAGDLARARDVYAGLLRLQPGCVRARRNLSRLTESPPAPNLE
jgi:hypothetical protein